MLLRPLRSLALLGAVLLLGCPDDVSQIPGGSTGSSGSSGPVVPPPTGLSTMGQTTEIADDTGTSTGSIGSSSGSVGSQDCCTEHADGGCDEPEVAACVCRQQATCCAFAWAAECVALAEGCGGCGETTGASSSSSTGMPPVYPCCDPVETPGCPEDPTIEACVCAVDAFCCDEQWDDICVAVAQRQCAASCGGGGNACCVPSAGSGCPEDAALEACVCAVDPFCCDEHWDSQCVEEAQTRCGNRCGGMMGGGDGDCCAANGTPGCDDMAVSACVCALDPFCCDNEWDDICVSEAQYDCMAGCGLPPANEGDCCMPTPGPGCDDMAVTTCVCAIDNDCCLFDWDDTCIQHAVNGCGSMCPGFDPQPPCCQVQMGPGCGDVALENCVCAFDPFCCDTQWDDICVGEAQMSCMLDCGNGGGTGDPPGAGDCCVANGTVGCEIPEVQGCVCMLDPFCCSVEWDAICVDEANVNCGGCMGPGTGSGGSGGSGSST